MISVGNDHYGRWVIWQDDPDWNIVKKAMDMRAGQYPVELKMLLEFLKSLNPSVIMEIGTHKAGTLWAMSRIIDPDGLLVSVDLPRSEINVSERCNLIQDRKVRWITSDSHHPLTVKLVEDALEGKSVDFLFIDGGHLYDSVRMDFEMYSPFVRHGGWVGFHDINPAEDPAIDVYPFWKKLKGFKIELSQYLPRNGIGIWRKD